MTTRFKKEPLLSTSVNKPAVIIPGLKMESGLFDACIGQPAVVQRFNIKDNKMKTVWNEYQKALSVQRAAWDKLIKKLPKLSTSL